MNAFDVGMFGMLPPEERKKILEGGSLYGGSLRTAGGTVDETQKEPWHKGMFWSKGKKDQGQGISLTDAGPLGPMQMQFDKQGNVLNQGAAILPSGKVLGKPDIQTQRYEPPIQEIGKKKIKTGLVNDDKSTLNEDDLTQDNMNLWSKMLGFGKKSAKEFKKSGGFDKLMANPAFTLGLAIMQSSAQGKRIDSELMNNFVKAAGISEHFENRLKAKVVAPIEATSGQIQSVKDTLATMDIKAPNIWERGIKKIFTGKNVLALYDEAAESIANAVELKVYNIKKAHADSGSKEPLVINREFRRKIIQDLINDGTFKKVSGTWFFTAGTLEAPYRPLENKAEGGPVQAGQPYVVGEGGPEYFLPQESGKVLSNDDSRIFAMLLTANPQLQNVSRTRSEKILRNRFPEYFE